jgi:hypothetical protein
MKYLILTLLAISALFQSSCALSPEDNDNVFRAVDESNMQRQIMQHNNIYPYGSF